MNAPPLSLVAVRQEAGERRHSQPLALAGRDELVEHDLRAIGEIAELRSQSTSEFGSDKV